MPALPVGWNLDFLNSFISFLVSEQSLGLSQMLLWTTITLTFKTTNDISVTFRKQRFPILTWLNNQRNILHIEIMFKIMESNICIKIKLMCHNSLHYTQHQYHSNSRGKSTGHQAGVMPREVTMWSRFHKIFIIWFFKWSSQLSWPKIHFGSLMICNFSQGRWKSYSSALIKYSYTVPVQDLAFNSFLGSKHIPSILKLWITAMHKRHSIEQIHVTNES